MQPDELEYVGFWDRLDALVLDAILLCAMTILLYLIFYPQILALTQPVIEFLSGEPVQSLDELDPKLLKILAAFILPLLFLALANFFVFFILPFLLFALFMIPVMTILFWIYKQATPGKMAVSAKIVDARTGDTPSVGQFVVRYFAYIISALPFALGFIWAAVDDRKQGWHDKLAGTVVVRKPGKRELRREELRREELRREKLRREDSSVRPRGF